MIETFVGLLSACTIRCDNSTKRGGTSTNRAGKNDNARTITTAYDVFICLANKSKSRPQRITFPSVISRPARIENNNNNNNDVCTVYVYAWRRVCPVWLRNESISERGNTPGGTLYSWFSIGTLFAADSCVAARNNSRFETRFRYSFH